MQIVTHSGTFHADESLAVFLLLNTSRFKGASIVRTRDQEIVSKADVVVDVGGIYDHSSFRYDHHQKSFTEDKMGIKLSSAGLHFGKEVIANILATSEEKVISAVYEKIYIEFIQAFDAVDNGIPQYEKSCVAKYKDSTTLSKRVSHLNPAWNSPISDAILYDLFLKAVELCGNEFSERVLYFGKSWLPGKDLVVNALVGRENAYVVVFNTYCPWKDHLFDLENELKSEAEKKLLYVIYPDEVGGNWRIQAVPEAEGSFISRKALPQTWRGLRDAELQAVSGVKDAFFVHATGFIGGAISKEGALNMASLAFHHDVEPPSKQVKVEK